MGNNFERVAEDRRTVSRGMSPVLRGSA